MEEGLVLWQMEDNDHHGDKRRHSVVTGDTLVGIAEHMAEDLLDPAGAGARPNRLRGKRDPMEYRVSRGRGEGIPLGVCES